MPEQSVNITLEMLVGCLVALPDSAFIYTLGMVCEQRVKKAAAASSVVHLPNGPVTKGN